MEYTKLTLLFMDHYIILTLAAALLFIYFLCFSGAFKHSSACVLLLAALFFFSIEKVNGSSIGLNFEVGNY